MDGLEALDPARLPAMANPVTRVAWIELLPEGLEFFSKLIVAWNASKG
jgi:hypothetical protein